MHKMVNHKMHTWQKMSLFYIKKQGGRFRPKNRVPWYPLELKKRRTRRLGFHKVSILPIYLTFWGFWGTPPFFTIFVTFSDFHFYTFVDFWFYEFVTFFTFLILSIFDDFWFCWFLSLFTLFYYFDLFFNFSKGILKIRPSFDLFLAPASTPMASTLGGSIPYVKFELFFFLDFFKKSLFVIIFVTFCSFFLICH